MEALLLYWLKANVVLALFAAAYYALLRRLTFFKLNRAYLLFALAFAAVYPLLPIPALLPAMPATLPPLVAAALPAASGAGGSGNAGSLPNYGPYLVLGAGAVYLAGVAGLLLRLLGQLLSLGQLRRRARPAVVLGQAVRLVAGAGGPFSFGSTIYLTDSALADPDNLPVALRHEQAHVGQQHTLDVLLWQLATALGWANPAAWLLRRAALDNLEYLADAAALRDAACSPRAYQYLLLHQQTRAVPAPALAFHFSLITLKNRIAMLNQPHSTSRQLGRYLLAAPLVVALALAYSGARAQSAGTAATMVQLTEPDAPRAALKVSYSTKADHVVYYLDGQLIAEEALKAVKPEDIASVEVQKDKATLQRYANDPTATGVIFIITKANANSPTVLALADKAGLSGAFDYTPREVNAVVPKALAYITSHYPDARLSGKVTEMKRKSTGEVQYCVQLAVGRRPFDVFFTPQGDFVSEQR